jgi:hypothetical protein
VVLIMRSKVSGYLQEKCWSVKDTRMGVRNLHTNKQTKQGIAYNVRLKHFRVTTFAREEINITCSECVSVALIFQHAKRVRCVILSFVPVLHYSIFPRYLLNSTLFSKAFIESQMRVSIFFAMFL